MDSNIGTATLRCECNCAMLVVDKYKFSYKGDDAYDDIDYSVSMRCSIFTDSKLLDRIKMAWKVLRNKKVSFRDLYIENESDMIKFRDDLTELISR